MGELSDAWGQAYLNFYRGGPSFLIFERDDGFVNAQSTAQEYFAGYKDWSSNEKAAIKYAKGRCLDAGCGAGRVSLYLQSRRLKVTAIDESSIAIKVCKLRHIKDARVLSVEGAKNIGGTPFDTILMFGNGFTIFGNREKAKRLLRNFFRLTSRVGTIIVESRDPYITDNPVHFAYHRRNIKLGRMPGQLRERVRFMQYCTDWFDALFASKKEVKNLLKGTGWKVAKFIDSPHFKSDGKFFVIMKKE